MEALANAFVMDWMMMWKELLAGFLIAGFIADARAAWVVASAFFAKRAQRRCV